MVRYHADLFFAFLFIVEGLPTRAQEHGPTWVDEGQKIEIKYLRHDGGPRINPPHQPLLPRDLKSKPQSEKNNKKTKKGSNSDLQAQKFLSAAVIEGSQHFEQLTPVPITDDDGTAYTVAANITLREQGIVTLAGAVETIHLVTCMDDSTIIIDFKEDLKAEKLEEMFPVDAILVVNADIFGDCMENSILTNMETRTDMNFDSTLYKEVISQLKSADPVGSFSRCSKKDMLKSVMLMLWIFHQDENWQFWTQRLEFFGSRKHLNLLKKIQRFP
jgi:hypothetical protein